MHENRIFKIPQATKSMYAFRNLALCHFAFRHTKLPHQASKFKPHQQANLKFPTIAGREKVTPRKSHAKPTRKVAQKAKQFYITANNHRVYYALYMHSVNAEELS